jgi:hypothetical protein
VQLKAFQAIADLGNLKIDITRLSDREAGWAFNGAYNMKSDTVRGNMITTLNAMASESSGAYPVVFTAKDMFNIDGLTQLDGASWANVGSYVTLAAEPRTMAHEWGHYAGYYNVIGDGKHAPLWDIQNLMHEGAGPDADTIYRKLLNEAGTPIIGGK